MTLALQNRIKSIFDFAYANSSIRIPATTCREVGKILHAGMYAEEVEGRIPAFSFDPPTLKKLNGSVTPEANAVCDQVTSLFRKMNKKWGFYKEDILFKPQEVGFIAGKLNDLYISDPKQDVFGDALELFRSTWAKQEGGQFFTDQRVTRLAVKMLRFDPMQGDDLVDICAGTGGFLLAGFNRIQELVQSAGGTEQKVAQLAAKSLKGLEIDADVASLGNATITARTGEYSVNVISQANSLDVAVFRRKPSPIKESSHRCLATNPPFGAKTPVRDEGILENYELARVSGFPATGFRASTKLHPRSPDILFMERNVNLLKPGEGRAAIVTPYQILSGPQSAYIRDWLIRNSVIEAVIDLPSETFQPHTGTKTSLLLVRRRERPLLDASHADDGTVFMATPKWIGHDRRGKPVYKVNSDGKLIDEILSDFDLVEQAYEVFLQGKNPEKIYAECFTASVKAIVSDPLLKLNAQSHKPLVHDAESSGASSKKWKMVRLGDHVERVFYPGRFKRNYVEEREGAIPFLGGSNITEFISRTDKWLRNDDPRLETLAVRAGWILITRSGTTGIISSVPEEWDGFAMSEHVIRIVPDPKKLDPYYLLSYLRTKSCQEQLKKGVFGSVIDEISSEYIADIQVPVPRKPAVLEKIVQKMRDAEIARNEAIRGFNTSVSELEKLIAD